MPKTDEKNIAAAKPERARLEPRRILAAMGPGLVAADVSMTL